MFLIIMVAMETQQRRGLLSAARNPDPKVDYVASLRGHMALFNGGGSSGVALRYVPDRLVLEPSAFGRYLNAMGAIEWASLEAAAATILNDISNELVARWVQVSVSAPPRIHSGILSHDVLLEDRQPNWDNPGLLSRLDSSFSGR